MKLLTQGEIEELRKLEAKATPGPLELEESVISANIVPAGSSRSLAHMPIGADSWNSPDRERYWMRSQERNLLLLFVAMRNALPRLLSMLHLPAARAAGGSGEDPVRCAVDRLLAQTPSPDEMLRISCDDATAILAALREAQNYVPLEMARLEAENAGLKDECDALAYDITTIRDEGARQIEALEKERDALAKRCEVMEWLVEVLLVWDEWPGKTPIGVSEEDHYYRTMELATIRESALAATEGE